MATTFGVALIADFDLAFPPHQATVDAVWHAGEYLGIEVEPQWIETNKLKPDAAAELTGFAGVWIAPGSPYQSLAGVLAAIRYARENDLPLLGTCGGFQHVVLEYARNVLGIADATHAEYAEWESLHPHPNPLPEGEGVRRRLFISRLACSLVGQTMKVRLTGGSRAAEAYGSLAAAEQYYCNFGINPAVVGELFGGGLAGASPARCDSTPAPAWGVAPRSDRTLTISGTDQDGEPRVIELAGQKFFVATLYVPQMRSGPGQPHPLVMAWLSAACRTDS